MCISHRYPMEVFHSQGVMNTYPALVGRQGVSTGVALRQRVQQRLGLLEISGVKAFGEPPVDWGQEVMGFLTFALLLPQARQTHGGTQLPGLGLLLTGNSKGLLETCFRLLLVRRSLFQQQLPLEAIEFGFRPAFLR